MRGPGLALLLVLAAALAAQPVLTFPPPKLAPPDDETRETIDLRVAKFGRAVEDLRTKGVGDPYLADVEMHLVAVRRVLKHEEFYPGTTKGLVAVLDQGLLRASLAARGESPWLLTAGQTSARAYRSRIDGSLQPYAVTLPADYGKARGKPYRIDVVLHGRDSGLTEVSFLHRHRGAKPAPAKLPGVQIDIFGRGNNAYRWAGESDVFEAVEHFFAVENMLKRGDLLDPMRVVLRGFSMGGAGTWHLGLHRPDQFVLLGPGAGFTTTHGYVGKMPEKLPDYQEACLSIYDAVEYAENVANVPVVAYSGEDDSQIAAARNIEARLKPLGLTMTHLVAPKLKHSFPPEWEKKAEAEYAKHAEHGRNAYPKKVRFVTHTLRYATCNWVELMALDRHYKQARVEAARTEGGFGVKTANVRQLRLGLWLGATREAVEVEIDGQKLTLSPYLSREGRLSVFLEKTGGKWAGVLPERMNIDRLRTPTKTAGLQGPIDDAFTAPFLCVRPTGTAWHEATHEYARKDLERFAHEWAKYMRGDLPIKDDADVTAEDIATKHLILFGDPSSNSLLAQVAPRLPLKWSAKTITLGGKDYDAAKHVPAMIYPSPLATDRYVVVNSGHTFHKEDFEGTNALLYPRLGDFAILGLVGDEKAPLAVKVETAGLFDEFWHLPGAGR